MQMMTTYELIRQLVKLDPEGNMPIMLAVKYAVKSENGNEVTQEAAGFIEGFTVEQFANGEPCSIIIESTDM